MALRLLGHIELPEHRANGGFDHADIHHPTDRLYVAHTSNDSIDVIDCTRDRYIESMPGLMGVAGALVSEAHGLVFTSNRGENTVSVFAPGDEQNAFKIAVGVKPNGLALDPTRGILIAANVGDPSIPDSYSVSVVDLGRRERVAEVKVPAARVGQFTTWRARCFSSISRHPRGSSPLMLVTPSEYRRSMRFRRRGHTD